MYAIASRGIGQRPSSVIKHGLIIVSGRPGPRPTLTHKHVHLCWFTVASRRFGLRTISLIDHGFDTVAGRPGPRPTQFSLIDIWFEHGLNSS